MDYFGSIFVSCALVSFGCWLGFLLSLFSSSSCGCCCSGYFCWLLCSSLFPPVLLLSSFCPSGFFFAFFFFFLFFFFLSFCLGCHYSGFFFFSSPFGFRCGSGCSSLLRSSLAFLLLGFGFAGGSFSSFCGSVSYLLLPLPPCFLMLLLALQVFLFFFFSARSSFWCSSPSFAWACFFFSFLLLALPFYYSAWSCGPGG